MVLSAFVGDDFSREHTPRHGPILLTARRRSRCRDARSEMMVLIRAMSRRTAPELRAVSSKLAAGALLEAEIEMLLASGRSAAVSFNSSAVLADASLRLSSL